MRSCTLHFWVILRMFGKRLEFVVLDYLILRVIRFVNVTDRFLGELSPVALGQVPKDLDMKYENLVKGIRHIQIKVNVIVTPVMDVYLMVCLGVASRGIRRNCRVHGVSVKVIRACAWSSSENGLCGDSCSTSASDWQGECSGLIAANTMRLSINVHRPPRRRLITRNGQRQSRPLTPGRKT
jgi:hypothetical protein